jgi:hypothetical protein
VAADTGVAHIAAAVGTPILSIFSGPALAGETAPYAPGTVIVQGWAHCAPCPESRPCPHRLCLALPTVPPVLAAARYILAQNKTNLSPSAQNALDHSETTTLSKYISPNPTENTLDSASEDNFTERVYIASADDLGQTLKPFFPIPLDDTEKLALAIREAAACLLKPNHNPNPDLLTLENYTYARPKQSPSENLALQNSIANLAFDNPTHKKTFVEKARVTLNQIESLAKNL